MPHIERMDLDGSYRQTVVAFEADQMLCLPFVTDGSALYARLETARVEGQGAGRARAHRPGRRRGDEPLPAGTGMAARRGRRNLILLDADGSYFAYDPATGARAR